MHIIGEWILSFELKPPAKAVTLKENHLNTEKWIEKRQNHFDSEKEQ